MITVSRLHELTKAQAETLRLLLHGDINPADISSGSTWVCQELQRPDYWGVEMFGRVVEKDREGKHLMAWVGLDPDPVGVIIIHPISNGEDILLFTFLVAANCVDQWQVADAMALEGLKSVMGWKRFVSYFPEHSWAADYARRCGFRSTLEGIPMKPNPNPILFWEIGVAELKKNIEALQ